MYLILRPAKYQIWMRVWIISQMMESSGIPPIKFNFQIQHFEYQWKYWWQIWQETLPSFHTENNKLEQLQLRLEQTIPYKGSPPTPPHADPIKQSETALFCQQCRDSAADNNAQGWDNRKYQLIQEREKQRETMRAWWVTSPFNNSLRRNPVNI